MDKVYIKSILQKILAKESSNQNKRKVVDYNDRLNFACPYCGDSHKNQYAKRGNLYFNRLRFLIQTQMLRQWPLLCNDGKRGIA